MIDAIDGLSSGIKSNEIIRKLKQVERQPIQRLRKEQGETQLEIDAFKNLIQIANNLTEASKYLYNFESALGAKKVDVLPSDAIRAQAKKNASVGEYDLQIKNIASKLTIASNQMSSSKVLPSGSISLNKQKHDFEGGSLKDLSKFFNKHYKKDLESKVIQTTPENSRLILKVKQEGQDGILNVQDPNGILQGIGIYQDKPIEKQAPKNTTPKKIPVLIQAEKLQLLEDALVTISPDNKQIQLKQNTSAILDMTLSIPPDVTIKGIEINLHSPEKKKPQIPILKQLYLATPLNITIKDVTLNTYTAIRKNNLEQNKDQTNHEYGVTLYDMNTIETNHNLQGKSGKHIIPISKSIQRIKFYTKNHDINFSEIYVLYEPSKKDTKTLKQDSGVSAPKQILSKEQQQNMFPNLIHPAEDAHLNIDGIDVVRKKNTEIDDIIPGVLLDLLKTSDQTIQVNVQHDIDQMKEQLYSFVKAYNELLEIAYQTSTVKDLNTKPGNFDITAKLQGKTPPLIADSSVRGLVNGLKKRISNPYPSFRKPNLTTIYDIGISTGVLGSEWSKISKGYLEVDEAKLIKYLNKHPIAVKELFGVDSNGDLRIDNGLGYTLHTFLQSYSTTYGTGILQNRIKIREEQIEHLDKNIEKIEEKATQYGERLKTKFGAMESAIRRQKATGDYLKQKFNQK